MIAIFYNKFSHFIGIAQGDCGLWNPRFVWLYAAADGLIALVYITALVTLLYLLVKSRFGMVVPWLKLEQQVRDRTQSLQHSENRLQLAFEASGEGLWDWDIATGDVYLNDRYQEMLGYAPGELVMNLDVWENMIHPDDKSWAVARFREHLSDRSVRYAFDYRLRCKSGEWKWVANHGKVVAYDAQGNPTRLIGVHIDISDRKATEAALAESRQQYQNLIENSPDIIERFDLNLRHLYVSPALHYMTGIAPEDFLGKTCRELGMNEGMITHWETAAETLLRTGQKQVIEFSTLTLQGVRSFEMAIAPEWSEQQTLQSILCISRDITERNKIRQALKTQRDFNQLIAEITSRFVDLKPDNLDLEIERTLRLISQVTQIDSSHLFTLDPDAGTMSMTHEWSQPHCPRQISRAQNIPLADFPWVNAKFEQREIVYVPNVADLPEVAAVDQASWQQFSLVAVLSVPLVKRNKAVGFIGFASFSQAVIWEEEAIRLLTVLGQTIVNAQQQAQNEQHLAISEERLRLALAATKQGLYDLNIQTGEAIVSPEYALMLGYDPATFEETNARWVERLHPDDREPVAATYRAYIAGALPEYKVEFRQRTRSGDYKWILSLGKVVSWDAEGQPLRMLGTHTDTDDRKQAEVERLRAEKLRVELALLETVLDAVLAGYWDTDYATQTNYWSPGIKRMFGYREDELPNDFDIWQKLIFKEDLLKVQDCFQRHIQSYGKEPYYNEVRYHHKNGSTVWVICAGQVIEWGATGQPLRMVGCHVDITRLKEAEAQLQKSDTHLRQAQRIGKLGSWEFDLTTEKITWSEEVFRLFKRDPVEGTPKSFEELQQLIYPDDREFHRQAVQQTIETQQPYDIEYRICCADGSVAYMQAKGETLVDATGKVILLTGTTLDITERKHIEARLLEKTAQLKASNQELEAFAYSVSHDLRAPLRAIDGFSKALLEDYGDQLDAEGQDYFARIRHNVQRMSMLIDDLLSLSRISRYEMQTRVVNLSALVEAQVTELKASEPERQVELIIAPNITVSADPTLMSVAIANLIANAWKFTSHHSSAQIEFGIIKQNEQWVYFIRDDGAGFDMAYADKLFGVFQRLHNTNEFPGTGIGLATVQRAIHRHGGEVWAKAAVEQGATIYFTIPELPMGADSKP